MQQALRGPRLTCSKHYKDHALHATVENRLCDQDRLHSIKQERCPLWIANLQLLVCLILDRQARLLHTKHTLIKGSAIPHTIHCAREKEPLAAMAYTAT